MLQRKMGKTGQMVSAFGFGTMRLPLLRQADGSTDYAQIDEPEATRMIRYAIDHGVNYFDTARFYHGANSELVLGRALLGVRDKVLIATKLPLSLAEKRADFDTVLNEQLKRLQTDRIDFYLLHGIGWTGFEKAMSIGVLDFLEKAKADGRIGHAGFSFHDQLPAFKKIVDAFDWEFCQIQFNLLDERYQAGREGLDYAAARGLGIAVMEPLRGGSLATQVPADVRAIWAEDPDRPSPAEAAFRWLLAIPGISVILSGVSTQEQLEDNIRIFSDTSAGQLSPAEQDRVRRVQEVYRRLIQVGCTSCHYCMPCPNGVAIPNVFSLYNNAFVFDRPESSRKAYQDLIDKSKDGSCCVQCGQCEPLCPQNLEIINQLAEADAYLRSGKNP